MKNNNQSTGKQSNTTATNLSLLGMSLSNGMARMYGIVRKKSQEQPTDFEAMVQQWDKSK